MLNDARKAFKENEFSLALEKYEYFFDHALDDDPSSFYGVRLSYCLNEWVKLGKKYPSALERLEEKREEAFEYLLDCRDPEKFHDYISISDHLGKLDDAIEKFNFLHESQPELANMVVRYIWKHLVTERKWDLCSAYLKDLNKNLSDALHKFDESMSICKSDPSLGGEDLEKQIRGWYVKDIGDVLLVLKYSERIEEFMSFRKEAFQKTEERGYPELVEKISERAAL